MKTFTLSKKDIAYLQPLDATMTGLNVAIQSYVIGTVYKRLGIEQNLRGRYDLEKGEIYVEEPSDAVAKGKPVAKESVPEKK